MLLTVVLCLLAEKQNLPSKCKSVNQRGGDNDACVSAKDAL